VRGAFFVAKSRFSGPEIQKETYMERRSIMAGKRGRPKKHKGYEDFMDRFWRFRAKLADQEECFLEPDRVFIGNKAQAQNEALRRWAGSRIPLFIQEIDLIIVKLRKPLDTESSMCIE